MELKNRLTLITGGARMGEAIALALARRGSDIILTYHHSKKAAETTAKKVRALGRDAFLIRADLGNSKALGAFISQINRKFKRLDALIYLASIYEKTALSRSDTELVSDWDKSMDIHVKSSYRLSLGVSRLMKKNGGGRIINVSDWLAQSGRPRYRDYLPYYIAKSAVIGLTEALALELAPEILVNAIAPGPILPPKGLSSKESAAVVRETPLKKWGGADEIAKAVLFLIETDFVTGECIRVDGGRHLY